MEQEYLLKVWNKTRDVYCCCKKRSPIKDETISVLVDGSKDGLFSSNARNDFWKRKIISATSDFLYFIIYSNLEIFLDVARISEFTNFQISDLECNGREKKYGLFKKETPKNSISEEISEYKVHRNRRSDKIGELQNSIAEDWKIASFKLHNTRARVIWIFLF